MPRLGSLSAIVSLKDLNPWTDEKGNAGWQTRCPACGTHLQRTGGRPSPKHSGAYQCKSCRRRIVFVD